MVQHKVFVVIMELSWLLTRPAQQSLRLLRRTCPDPQARWSSWQAPSNTKTLGSMHSPHS